MPRFNIDMATGSGFRVARIREPLSFETGELRIGGAEQEVLSVAHNDAGCSVMNSMR